MRLSLQAQTADKQEAVLAAFDALEQASPHPTLALTPTPTLTLTLLLPNPRAVGAAPTLGG